MMRWLIMHVLQPMAGLAVIASVVYVAVHLSSDPKAQRKNEELERNLNELRIHRAELERRWSILSEGNRRLRTDPQEKLYYARTLLSMVGPEETLYLFEEAKEAPSEEAPSEEAPSEEAP